jgi:hypothetical protein
VKDHIKLESEINEITASFLQGVSHYEYVMSIALDEQRNLPVRTLGVLCIDGSLFSSRKKPSFVDVVVFFDRK